MIATVIPQDSTKLQGPDDVAEPCFIVQRRRRSLSQLKEREENLTTRVLAVEKALAISNRPVNKRQSSPLPFIGQRSGATVVGDEPAWRATLPARLQTIESNIATMSSVLRHGDASGMHRFMTVVTSDKTCVKEDELGHVEVGLQTRRRPAPVRARERSVSLDAHEDFVQVFCVFSGAGMPSYHAVAAPLWRANVVQVFHVCGGFSDSCEDHIAFQSKGLVKCHCWFAFWLTS